MKIKRVLKWTFGLLLLALFIWFEVVYWTSSNNCDAKSGPPPHPMKAIRYCEYGSPDDVLKLQEVEKPIPNDDQILVRVRAVSLRFYDGSMLQGGVGRLIFGLRKPRNTCPGSDFSGTVEAVGRNVTEFQPGEEVFGVRAGALAQYICVRRNGALVSKPSNLSFEQAASVPTALVALQGLRDTGHVKAGQKVLINGASGGVGTFAVQIAKSFGADVTGVCSTRNIELVQSLGADHVIDYTKEDFTKGDQKYDVILDNVANHSLSECRRVLTPNGIYVLIGGGSANEQGFLGGLGKMLNAAVYSRFVKQKMGMMMAQPSTPDLTLLAEMVQSGKLKTVIDRTYKSLSEVPDAIRYLEEGHAKGKVIITVE